MSEFVIQIKLAGSVCRSQCLKKSVGVVLLPAPPDVTHSGHIDFLLHIESSQRFDLYSVVLSLQFYF